MQEIHFLSGLPRAGSTLLGAIFNQNPQVHAGMSSPVCPLFNGLLAGMADNQEGSVFLSDSRRKDILRGLFYNYYASVPKPVVIDTSRGWSSNLRRLQPLFPRAKVILCVREVGAVLDSLERMALHNPLHLDPIHNYSADGNVISRTLALASGSGMVGRALDALRGICADPMARGRVCLVRYESLVRDPDYTVKVLYGFLGLESFQHDFEHVTFNDSGFDAKLGMRGLHSIRPVVREIERERLIPDTLYKTFANDSFWNHGLEQPLLII